MRNISYTIKLLITCFVSLFCIVFNAEAQLAPAGVNNNLRLWLNAEMLNTGSAPANGAGISQWRDISIKSKAVYTLPTKDSYVAAPRYRSEDKTMNFKPSVYFDRVAGNDGFRRYLSSTTGVMSTAAPQAYTFITVSNIDFESVPNTGTSLYPQTIVYFMGFGEAYLSGSNTDANAGLRKERIPAFGLTGGVKNAFNGKGAGRYIVDPYGIGNGTSDTYFDGKKSLFDSRSTTISIHEVKAGEYIQYETNGYVERLDKNSGLTNTQMGYISKNAQMNKGSMLGTGSRPARNMIGAISEVIAYEGILSNDEKVKIYTYLGLKYGVTINNINTINGMELETKHNYVLSGNTGLWLGTSLPLYRKYHHNVAAIVRDDGFYLNQKKACSSHENNFVSIELLKDGLMDNMQAIVWGDNGASGSARVITDKNYCGPNEYDMARLYFIDSQMLPGDKNMRLYASGFSDIFGFQGQGWNTYLLIAKNETDAQNKNWDMVIPGTYINGEHVFNFLLTDEYKTAFFSFGGTRNPAAQCAACTFHGEEKLLIKRSNTNWGGKMNLTGGQTLIKSNIKTENGNFSMSAKFEAEAGTTLSVEPKAVHDEKNPVHLKASGKANAISRITYTLQQPANVEFVIGDIDGNEVVEVCGYCGTDRIRPVSVEKLPLKGFLKHTYNIQNVSRMVGNGTQSAGRGNNRGKVSIRFGVPVEKIVIEYTNASGALRWLDLYPLTFSCPPQPPVPNEAGYALQKRGPADVNICGTVDYSFFIMNSNSGCDPEPVLFKDELPQGMFWVPGSLNITANQLKPGYSLVMKDRTFDLDGLLLPGWGKVTHIKAQAAFEDDAVAGSYYNRSEITYKRKDNGVSEALSSTDAFYVSGNDKRTKTMATGSKTYKSVTTNMTFTPSACFRDNGEVLVDVEINNPNGAISSNTNNILYFETYFNENFSYKAGSLKIGGTLVNDNGPDVYIDNDNGMVSIEGALLNLPANGVRKISYIIKVPQKTDLISDNINGKKEYDDLYIGHTLTCITTDLCLQNAFLKASNEYSLSLCKSPGCIIVNRMLQARLKK